MELQANISYKLKNFPKKFGSSEKMLTFALAKQK